MKIAKKLPLLLPVTLAACLVSLPVLSGEKKSANRYVLDPVFEDYMRTMGSNALDSGDFRDSPYSVSRGGDFRVMYSNIVRSEEERQRFENLEKLKENSVYESSPLFYKVRFPWENGPIESNVIPFGYDARDVSAKNFLFVKITASQKGYEEFLGKLKKSGFMLFSEKEILDSNRKAVGKKISGWLPSGEFAGLLQSREAVKVSIAKSGSFSPMAKVGILVRIPYYLKESVFLPAFLKEMEKRNGFSLDDANLIERDLVSVTGEIPLNEIENVYASPFVLQLRTF